MADGLGTTFLIRTRRRDIKLAEHLFCDTMKVVLRTDVTTKQNRQSSQWVWNPDKLKICVVVCGNQSKMPVEHCNCFIGHHSELSFN